jgi:hypothetical protein
MQTHSQAAIASLRSLSGAMEWAPHKAAPGFEQDPSDYDRSSSNAFAALRSAVANPSVNRS